MFSQAASRVNIVGFVLAILALALLVSTIPTNPDRTQAFAPAGINIPTNPGRTQAFAPAGVNFPGNPG